MGLNVQPGMLVGFSFLTLNSHCNQIVSMANNSSNVTVGKIVRPHGIKGYVRVYPTTDNPKRFQLLKVVRIKEADGCERELDVENMMIQRESLLLKFKQISNRQEAEKLRGAEIIIDRSECLPLEANSYYIFDLIGMRVLSTSGKEIGLLQEVLNFPANDVYVVRDHSQEHLIPAIADVVKKIDVEKGLMVIEPMDGLLSE